MAAKYQLITELYRRTGIAVAKNPQAWQSFLAAACRNYKCRFDEQLLIYAQRPEAIAVAELDTWNKRFKRWVNKDSKGIAVFDPKGRRNTLKYYFDVSDTHDGYYGSRPVPIWQMNGRYEQAVIERLSDRFGNAESADLASALIETAKNAVEDNLQDYFSQLKGFTRDSFLEELDDFNVEVCYRRLVTNRVAFMLMSRCGLDTTEHFDREDFETLSISIRLRLSTPSALPQATFPKWLSRKFLLRYKICKSQRKAQIAPLYQKAKANIIKAEYNPKGAKIMNAITYSRQGDYLIPDLTLPTEQEIPLGRYAQMHRSYLEQHKRVTYLNLLTSGKLNEHLYQTEQTALQRLELLTKQLSAEQGVTEELKEKAPMQWVQRMNNIRSQAEEVIMTELIYK